MARVSNVFGVAVMVCVVVMATLVNGEIHSRIANHVEQLGPQRFSFCMHSVAVPSSEEFGAALFFTFGDAETGQPLSDEEAASHSYVVGFPNADARLVRAQIRGSRVVLHQGDISFFNWDAAAFTASAYTTGIILSSRPLLSVVLVVEAETLVSLPDADLFSCDGPVFFVDENPQNDADVIAQLPSADTLFFTVDLFGTIQQPSSSSSSSLIWIEIVSVIIVAVMSVACVVRICCIRCRSGASVDAATDDQDWIMAPADEEEEDIELNAAIAASTADIPLFPMQPQPIMTAAGVQYVMVPQEFVLAQQQQMQQMMQQQPPMYMYPGNFVAQPQQ